MVWTWAWDWACVWRWMWTQMWTWSSSESGYQIHILDPYYTTVTADAHFMLKENSRWTVIIQISRSIKVSRAKKSNCLDFMTLSYRHQKPGLPYAERKPPDKSSSCRLGCCRIFFFWQRLLRSGSRDLLHDVHPTQSQAPFQLLRTQRLQVASGT